MFRIHVHGEFIDSMLSYVDRYDISLFKIFIIVDLYMIPYLTFSVKKIIKLISHILCGSHL